MNATKRLAILLSFSGAGGVERMVLNLLPPILRSGVEVDLLAIRRTPCPELNALDHPGLRVLDLGVSHTTLAIPGLVRYLRRERPDALLAAKDRGIRVALLARKLSGIRPRLVGRLGTHLSASLENKPVWVRCARRWPMRFWYRDIDCVIAVSAGVAEDTHVITGLPEDRIAVIRNPVITPDLLERSRERVEHPWLETAEVPILLGAGRLTVQKDFATLIRAFARVRAARPCRLVILGEGRQRPQLQALAQELGVADAVALPGRADNPYAWMARSSLFVLSSAWEGSPNVLAEALALGIPAVSTDCPSGPREILDGGRYGPLTPVGDPESLAEAMLRVLAVPPSGAWLRTAVEEYTAERSARRYLEVLGLADRSRGHAWE